MCHLRSYEPPESLGVRELFCRLPLLICLGGEFDLDLRAEGAGNLLERRQRHPIIIFPLQARDVGVLHADPPREIRLGPAFLQPGSDQTLRELKLRAGPFILSPYL